MNRAPNSSLRLRLLASPPSIGWGTTLVLAASSAFGLAGGVWLRDATLAAESRFLALLAGLVLIPTFSLRRGSRLGFDDGLAPLLVLLAGWTLPPPARGAAVVALLVAGLFAASLRVSSWTFDRLVAAAIAVQVLARSDLLLGPVAPALVHWLVLPVAAATGIALLERAGDRRGITAGTLSVCVAGGITAAAALALLSLGAAGWACGRSWRVRGAVLSGALVLDGCGGVASRWQWWSPAEAVLVVASVVVLFGIDPQRARLSEPTVPIPALEWRRWWGAVILLAGAVLPLLSTSRPWSTVGRDLGWLPALLPFLGPALASLWRRDVGDRAALVSAVAVAGVALRALPPPQALPVVLVLGVFALPARSLGPSVLWGSTLLAGSVVLGSYPWLREVPLDALVAALQFPPLGWGLALSVALAASVWSRMPRLRQPLGWILLGLVALRIALAGPWEVLHAWPPVDLGARQRTWVLSDLDGVTSELIIDTTLANSAGLEPGTKVAELRLVSHAPRADVRWPLHLAEETGEWAASREDLLDVEAPRPWLVTVDPTGRFFAHRYRARLRLPEPLAFDRLVFRRAPGLPRDVVVSMLYLARRTAGEHHRSPPATAAPPASAGRTTEDSP